MCASERGKDNITRDARAVGHDRDRDHVRASSDDARRPRAIDKSADLILLSREALAAGLDATFSRPDRIRPWTYEFDPSGLELLRRAIEHVALGRPSEAVPA